jgi:DNA-binding NtrC family response regulator
VRIRIPPLRERPEDIPLLVSHLLRQLDDGGPRRISGALIEYLVTQPLPLNCATLSCS